MTAVKTLAIGALVIGAAAQAAWAGPYSGHFAWSAWNDRNRVAVNAAMADPINLHVSNFAPVVAPTPPPTPTLTPTPMPSGPLLAVAPAASFALIPVPTPPMAFAPAPAPIYAAAMPSPAPAASAVTYDAFVNLGNAPFVDATNLTASTPQAWANSTAITGLFGGHPTDQQQADFNSAVLQRVEQTFQLAGVHVNLTSDPNAQSNHTLSVVSNTTSAWGPLLGLTNIGGNGFDFIDEVAKSANSINDLEWIVAHNVSHELMLAFGVGEKYDKSGSYIDAEMANLSMMLDPNATFSQGAAAALLSSHSLNTNGTGGAFAQEVGPQPVPEPTTVAIWAIAAIGLAVARRHRSRNATA